MHARLHSQRMRVSVLAGLAGLAAAVGFAAAPPAHAQFGGGTISGHVEKPNGEPLEGATVTAVPSGGGDDVSSDTTNASGNYTIASPLVPPGDYNIRFEAAEYVTEYYDNASDLASATDVEVDAFADTPNIDATMTPQARISGTVTDSVGAAAPGICVTAHPQSGGVTPPAVTTAADGTYTLGLEAGTYAIEFDPCTSTVNALGEWYDDAPDESSADTLTVSAGDNQTGVNAQLAAGGSISGTVVGSNGQPASGATVNVRTAFGVLESRSTAANGTYTVGQLPTGSYTVEFVAPFGSYDLTEYYDNAPNEASATPVVVNVGANTPNINANLEGDTTPPVITINGGPTGPTNDTTPTFDFSTEAGATLQCSIDTGTPSYGPCSGAPTSHTPSSPLADGSYTFRVKATDGPGNASEDTRSFSVDTQAPAVGVTGGPSGPTGFTAPSFTFSTEAGATYECAIDQAGDPTPDYGSCSGTNSHAPAAPLPDGDWIFRVRATDTATNSAVAQRAFTVDSDGPNVSITGGPTGPTNDATPTFDFTASQNATLECAVDPASAPTPAYGACSQALSHTPTTLADGDYVFRVRATDDASNQTSAQRSFTLDTVAPTLSVDGGPSGPTNDATPNFTFSASDGTLQCAIDPSGAGTPSWGSCTGASGHDSGNLADGSYVFRVRTTDAAGNTTSAQRAFSVDTGTSVSITSGPNGPTSDSTPTFGFNAEAGATVECSVDTGTPSYGACSNAAAHTSSALANGSYTFRVRVTDAATNSQVATRNFSVDTVAPGVSVTGGPAGETGDPQPTFTFSAEAGAAVQCSLDTGSPAFGACSSGSSHTPSAPLNDGSYVFRVRATDAAGNSSTAVRAFELDVVTPPPPDTDRPTVKITDGPKSKTKDKTPTFAFESNDDLASFTCKVDGGAAFKCSSPTTLKKLKPGRHTFSVFATDKAGNEGAPATQTFTVKKKKKKRK